MSIAYKIKPYNKENDSMLMNQIMNNHNDNSLYNKQENNKKISQIRKNYLKKLQVLEQQHKDKIISMKSEFQKQKNGLQQAHAKQIQLKDNYINILESLVKTEGNITRKIGKNIVQDAKQLYTQQYSKNYVPFFQDIENKIDFKIELNRKNRNFSMSRNKATNRQNIVNFKHSEKSLMLKSSSHHKLIPKSKPESLNQISSFKLMSDTYKLKHECFIN